MTKGILIFAHNNEQVDYAKLALVSGSLAKKYLKVPISLVTDKHTLEWIEKSKLDKDVDNVFEHVIEVPPLVTDNNRYLYDGKDKSLVPFANINRCSAYDLTPYDKTLLIDSDFLIFSNALNNYWDVCDDILIAESVVDAVGQHRLGHLDHHISDTGIKMRWATTVMFEKNEKARRFFNLISYIKDEYEMFADLFRFNPLQYRNDISFSIAKHIMDGYTEADTYHLPTLLTALDRDILIDVKNNDLIFLFDEKNETFAGKIQGRDIHIMNKQSLIRNASNILEII